MNFLDISNAEEFMMWALANTSNVSFNSIHFANLVYGQICAANQNDALLAHQPASIEYTALAIDNWILKNIHWLKEITPCTVINPPSGIVCIHFKLGPYAWNLYRTDDVYDSVYAKLYLDKEDI